jgi:hypothetical protein
VLERQRAELIRTLRQSQDLIVMIQCGSAPAVAGACSRPLIGCPSHGRQTGAGARRPAEDSLSCGLD